MVWMISASNQISAWNKISRNNIILSFFVFFHLAAVQIELLSESLSLIAPLLLKPNPYMYSTTRIKMSNQLGILCFATGKFLLKYSIIGIWYHFLFTTLVECFIFCCILPWSWYLVRHISSTPHFDIYFSHILAPQFSLYNIERIHHCKIWMIVSRRGCLFSV